MDIPMYRTPCRRHGCSGWLLSTNWKPGQRGCTAWCQVWLDEYEAELDKLDFAERHGHGTGGLLRRIDLLIDFEGSVDHLARLKWKQRKRRADFREYAVVDYDQFLKIMEADIAVERVSQKAAATEGLGDNP